MCMPSAMVTSGIWLCMQQWRLQGVVTKCILLTEGPFGDHPAQSSTLSNDRSPGGVKDISTCVGVIARSVISRGNVSRLH